MLEVVAAGEHTEFVALEAGSFGDSRAEAGIICAFMEC